MEKRNILGGIGCIWRLGVTDKDRSTLTRMDDGTGGLDSQNHDGSSTAVRSSYCNHKISGRPLMDISNEERAKNGSNVRRLTLRRDGDEGKRCCTTTGDIFLGDEEVTGGSSLYWPKCTHRGIETCDSIAGTCLDAAAMTTPLTTSRQTNDRKGHRTQSESRSLVASGSVVQENSKTRATPNANSVLTTTSRGQISEGGLVCQTIGASSIPSRKAPLPRSCVDDFLCETSIVDESYIRDPFYYATEYIQEMLDHFRRVESVTSVRSFYMEHQKSINENMRSVLVDWLVDIHASFRLVPETLHLTVNLIDRYLERRQVIKRTLQLVGVSCLLIASKYEECLPLTLSDLAYVCDNAYQTSEISSMELDILEALDYRVAVPSAFLFLKLYLWAAHADRMMVNLSSYIVDGTLMCYNLLDFAPSQVAAAAVFISRHSMGRSPWSPKLLQYTSYQEQQVIPVARAILSARRASCPNLHAVVKKYSSDRFDNVARSAQLCNDLQPI